jgi:hypothetical protein
VGNGSGNLRINDVDIVVRSFDDLPPGLREGFLCIHVHPDAPPGKILIQLVDPGEALRVDIFRTIGETRARARVARVLGMRLRVVSLEDLAARAVRELMNLSREQTVPRKYADQFRRTIDRIDPTLVEKAWSDHRKPHDPVAFSEAVRKIASLLVSRNRFLGLQRYVTNIGAVCERCRSAGPFEPAPPGDIFDILGYR